MELEQRIDSASPGVQRRSVGFSGLIALALGGAVLLLPKMPHPLESAATIAMIATLFAFLLMRARDRRLDWFEVLFPVGLLYVVHFGVGAIHMKANPGRLFGPSLDSHVTAALGVAMVGFVAMLLGYGTLFRQARPLPALAAEPTGAGIVLLGCIGALGTGGAVLQVLLVTGGGQVSAVFSFLNQFAPIFFLAWALVWYMFWAKRLDGRGKLAFVLVLIPCAIGVIAATFGAKQTTILVLLMPLMARWYARRTMPWVPIATLILLVLFVVFPLYNTYRTHSRDLGAMNRLDRTFDSANRWTTDDYLERSTTAFLDRMAVISSVAAILRDVPDRVDYKYGSTLILAPVSLLVPRFLWPDKPIITIGREFGVTFLLVSSWDRETLIAPSIVGDFYWNFALPGVAVGLFLFGGAMRWYYQRFGAGTGYDPMRKAAYMSLLSFATQVEGNAAALAAGMIKTVLIILLTTYLLKRFGLTRDLLQAN